MEPFKNVFSEELVRRMAGHLVRADGAFDADGFIRDVLAELEAHELKRRAQLIADEIRKRLPEDPARRADILAEILHPETGSEVANPTDDRGIRGWGIFPLTMIVGQHGIDDFDRSMELMRKMTMRFTSEFGIRYFLLADQTRALDIMKNWVTDESEHVRRLVSEGTRPRLPWAMQLPDLIADPSPVLPLLEALRDDPSEYVRRSVANHLNDIAKDHPDRVAAISADWMTGADRNRERLLRHACRTLIKQGHADTLAVFGLHPPEIDLVTFATQNTPVRFGEKLAFGATIASTTQGKQDLVIDYVLHFLKANGSLAPKVFKWTSLSLAAGETRELAREHPIKPITTRKYYPGEQGISLRINGRDFGFERFTLLMEE